MFEVQPSIRIHPTFRLLVTALSHSPPSVRVREASLMYVLVGQTIYHSCNSFNHPSLTARSDYSSPILYHLI